jgi:1-acyl-sn-glycerol-3-phosphate acyltransferase
LLIFPEGTRTHDGSIQKAKSGIGFILEMANVPIVPAKITGSYNILPKGKIVPKLGEKLTVRYGVPFLIEKLDKKLERKVRYSKMAEQVMSKISEL